MIFPLFFYNNAITTIITIRMVAATMICCSEEGYFDIFLVIVGVQLVIV